MKIGVFIAGCVLALPSWLGLVSCLLVAWSLQHPSAGESPYDLHDTAVGGLIFILIALLLATIANLLIGIAAHGMGAPSEKKGDGAASAPIRATDR